MAVSGKFRQDERGELHERAERFQSIFENSTLGIFQSSLEGRFLIVNPAFEFRTLRRHLVQPAIRNLMDTAEKYPAGRGMQGPVLCSCWLRWISQYRTQFVP